VGLKDADSLKNNSKGQNCPSSNKDHELADLGTPKAPNYGFFS
jgi:hypothetical protein